MKKILDEEKVIESYISGLNLVECGEKFSVSGPTIRKILLRRCPGKIRSAGQQAGRKKSPILSEAVLHDTGSILENFFSYNPNSGIFTHKTSRGGRSSGPGGQAGNINKKTGYITIGLPSRKPCLAHRLAWLWMTGEWPKSEIDHINLNRLDNRFENLRLATRSQNSQNGPIRSTNKSGTTGVFFDKSRGKYVACVSVNYDEKLFRKRYDTLEEAVNARLSNEKEFFGEFAPSNRGAK